MQLAQDGLRLWYGTHDAPAPSSATTGSVSLEVGVSPIHPANSVEVRYRSDDGPLHVAYGVESRRDERRDAQYFRVRLPVSPGARSLEYCPILRRGSFAVPRAGSETFTRLTVADAPAPAVDAKPKGLRPRFTPGLTLAGQITVQLKPPIVIGQTPNGFRIDFYAASGALVGDGFRAQVFEDSVDYMLVRPDGIGVLDIHATLKTDDGALITASYSGLIEFGEDGYRRMVAGDWPDMPRHQVAPRLLTESSRYLWLNRTQFLGVGQVDMRALIIKYDVYAVATLVEPGAWEPR
jgi:hypothetical protein